MKNIFNKKIKNHKIIIAITGFIWSFAPTLVLATPDPLGGAEIWIQGQLQTAVRIFLMVGLVALVISKKVTSILPWVAILIFAAVGVWNPDLIINFLRAIGDILLG